MSLQITLGEHDISATGEGSLTEKTVAIAAISRHESYNAASSSHDIAVLELAQEVDLDTYTPACMAQVGSTYHYGVTSDNTKQITLRARTRRPSTARRRWCTAGGPLLRAGACPRCYWR